jgi:hypothetical protein
MITAEQDCVDDQLWRVMNAQNFNNNTQIMVINNAQNTEANMTMKTAVFAYNNIMKV